MTNWTVGKDGKTRYRDRYIVAMCESISNVFDVKEGELVCECARYKQAERIARMLNDKEKIDVAVEIRNHKLDAIREHVSSLFYRIERYKDDMRKALIGGIIASWGLLLVLFFILAYIELTNT